MNRGKVSGRRRVMQVGGDRERCQSVAGLEVVIV